MAANQKGFDVQLSEEISLINVISGRMPILPGKPNDPNPLFT